MTEHDAELLLAQLFERDAAQVGRQVRLGGKIVDLVVDWVSDEPNGDIESIEVKLRDWRRAVRQAYASSGYVGRSSIAMPVNSKRRVDESYLRELGVGLIEFDADSWWRVIAPARRPTDLATLEHVRIGMTSES
jgi:hypothetical protein